MVKGRGGMGSHKHGVSGKSGRSPRFKHQTMIEAQKEEAGKKKKPPLPFSSVSEAIKRKR